MAEETVPGNRPESLEGAEQLAKQIMQDQLGQHLSLTYLTTNTIAFMLSHAPALPLAEVRQSLKVVTMLLVRISNDIRAGRGQMGSGMTIDLLEPSHFAPNYRPSAARSSQRPRFIPNHTPSAISHMLDEKSWHSQFPDLAGDGGWQERRSPEARGTAEPMGSRLEVRKEGLRRSRVGRFS
jgi:hypothetical protein